MVFSLTETNQGVYSSKRFNRAICTLWAQIKTFFCEMAYALLYVFIISIVLTILFLLFMWATKIEDVYSYSMGFAVVIGVIILLVMTQFLYATYIAIITDEEGFDAVRLSQMIFNRNKLKTILLFVVQIGFPMISYLSMEYFKIPMQYSLIINFLNSLVSFLVLIYIGHFLPKAMVYNHGKVENIEIE